MVRLYSYDGILNDAQNTKFVQISDKDGKQRVISYNSNLKMNVPDFYNFMNLVEFQDNVANFVNEYTSESLIETFNHFRPNEVVDRNYIENLILLYVYNGNDGNDSVENLSFFEVNRINNKIKRIFAYNHKLSIGYNDLLRTIEEVANGLHDQTLAVTMKPEDFRTKCPNVAIYDANCIRQLENMIYVYDLDIDMTSKMHYNFIRLNSRETEGIINVVAYDKFEHSEESVINAINNNEIGNPILLYRDDFTITYYYHDNKLVNLNREKLVYLYKYQFDGNVSNAKMVKLNDFDSFNHRVLMFSDNSQDISFAGELKRKISETESTALSEVDLSDANKVEIISEAGFENFFNQNGFVNRLVTKEQVSEMASRVKTTRVKFYLLGDNSSLMNNQNVRFAKYADNSKKIRVIYDSTINNIESVKAFMRIVYQTGKAPGGYRSIALDSYALKSRYCYSDDKVDDLS